jgi:predicted nucleotidyltransferase
MPVQDIHSQCLIRSTALSGYYMERLIAPLEVIRVLNDAGVRFLLVGLHGIGGWMRKPRATEDVDVLVANRGHKKAVKALLEAFPYLEAQDEDVVTRLRDPESDVVKIDLIKPNQPLFREVLKHGHPVTVGGQTYNIPTLEAALAMKFAPMISLNRAEEDRHQDAHDFMYMIKANAEIDLPQLEALGALVYPSGGKEVLELVRKVRNGEKLIV